MSVMLGTGQDGKPVTSAALRPMGDFSSDLVHKMSDMQLLALNAYEAAVAAVGTLNPEGFFAGLHLPHWRDHFSRKHTGDTLDTKRRAFNRARKDLVELRRFKVEDDIYHPDGDLASFEVAIYPDKIKKRDKGQ